MTRADAAAEPTSSGVDPLASDPAGWTAVVDESVPGASVRRVTRLGGGAAAEAFAVDTTAGPLVVKRYGRRRGETVRLEWERLSFAQRVAVQVPRPLAVDGRWFGLPAYAMTRLPGQPDVHPSDVDGWLEQLASALVAIHSTDPTGADGALLRPPAIRTWRTPRLRHPDELTDRAVAAIQRHLPSVSWQPVLIHGDFHPGNTLWRDGRLTGITDWSGARLGPRSCDLAYCRADLALLLGPDSADRFARHYATIAGAEPADLPVFDLLWGLDALRKRARVIRAHRERGRTTSPREFTARAAAFLQRALAELGTP